VSRHLLNLQMAKKMGDSQKLFSTLTLQAEWLDFQHTKVGWHNYTEDHSSWSSKRRWELCLGHGSLGLSWSDTGLSSTYWFSLEPSWDELNTKLRVNLRISSHHLRWSFVVVKILASYQLHQIYRYSVDERLAWTVQNHLEEIEYLAQMSVNTTGNYYPMEVHCYCL
jgi:hypothetical protein